MYCLFLMHLTIIALLPNGRTVKIVKFKMHILYGHKRKTIKKYMHILLINITSHTLEPRKIILLLNHLKNIKKKICGEFFQKHYKHMWLSLFSPWAVSGSVAATWLFYLLVYICKSAICCTTRNQISKSWRLYILKWVFLSLLQ